MKEPPNVECYTPEALMLLWHQYADNVEQKIKAYGEERGTDMMQLQCEAAATLARSMQLSLSDKNGKVTEHTLYQALEMLYLGYLTMRERGITQAKQPPNTH